MTIEEEYLTQLKRIADALERSNELFEKEQQNAEEAEEILDMLEDVD